MHSSFYADPFTHRCLYTEKLLRTEVSAHSTLLHTASFYTERLCFPFLIAYLSRSPSQVDFACLILIIYGCDLYIRYVDGEREREREMYMIIVTIIAYYVYIHMVCIGVRTMRLYPRIYIIIYIIVIVIFNIHISDPHRGHRGSRDTLGWHRLCGALAKSGRSDWQNWSFHNWPRVLSGGLFFPSFESWLLFFVLKFRWIWFDHWAYYSLISF